MHTYSTLSVASVVCVIAVSVLGCSSYTGTIPYYAPALSSILSDSGPVAVYLFREKGAAADGSKRIGGVYRALGEPARFIYNTEQPTLEVTRAFAAGLRSGKVSVIDLTLTPFGPAVSTKETPIALTGEVRKFWTEAKFGLAGFPGYRFTFTAECRVLIEVYRAGSKAWDKEYSQQAVETAMQYPNLDSIAAQTVNRLGLVLRKIVEEAVNDPDFTQAIRRPGS